MLSTSRFRLVVASFTILCACKSPTAEEAITPTYTAGQEIKMDKNILLDKIKGGWAGQVIGCTYGGPTEFRFNGTMIGDEVPIPWDGDQMLWWYENVPGLYDDVYMDLTFVDIFEKHGIDAPDSLHALAFAKAEYQLWHANQAARYNILQGMMPPASGYWKNNPHADDIDFQIEADFAGLMSPGMINAAATVGDRIGHIMNYGDGVYGGVYVAGMYALAFIHNDVEYVVKEALKAVPKESEFHQCIADVIRWHRQYPDDWKQTWFEVQKKWSNDKGCPDGVFKAFNIDAKINAAYIVIGLLYGNGDYGKTIDISTRCGLDSDCNPANAAGILGTMIGYSQIPDYWKQGLDKVEDMDFKYTTMSLNKVYEIGMDHALQMVERNGGKVEGDEVTILYQVSETLPLEVAFEGLYPIKRGNVFKNLDVDNPEVKFAAEGKGLVITGYAGKDAGLPDAELVLDVYVDNQVVERVKMPTGFQNRKHEVFWNYDLTEGAHEVKLVPIHIPKGYSIHVQEYITYSAVQPPKRTY